MSTRVRKILIAIAMGLLCAHALSAIKFGPAFAGECLSDLIQLVLGLMLVPTCLVLARRSTGVSRHYWRLTAMAFILFDIAQLLATVQDVMGTAQHMQLIGFLFYFWYAPIAMALFLDPESDSQLDRLALVDLIQGLLFLVTAYVYFFMLSAQSQAVTDLASGLQEPYLVVHTLIAVAFIFRAAMAQGAARKFLARMGVFLLFSCAVDVLYYYGPGQHLLTGDWFDVLWSVSLIIPLLIAVTWPNEQPAHSGENPESAARSQLVTQLFTLLFPAVVLIMSAQIARQRAWLAAFLLLGCFACSSARLLLTQKRLLTAQDELRREATHDGLTSAWNHAGILGILDRELLRAHRSGTFLGVMMIDVDRFKSINDSFGHAAGDAVLRALAREFGEVLRSYDSLGRYGGEEFLVVAPGCGLTESHELAERIRAHVETHAIASKDGAIPVTISIGVTASGGASSAEHLLQEADAALYVAKASGRNRVELSSSKAPEFMTKAANAKATI
jgi:diguanylate cyclase (GGDEF)-like protein